MARSLPGLQPLSRVGKSWASTPRQGMIAAAQPKACENLRFVRMDINSLSFSEEFDVAFSNATLHWVKDHQRLYKASAAHFVPAAGFASTFAGQGNCSHFFRVIQESHVASGVFRLFCGFRVALVHACSG